MIDFQQVHKSFGSQQVLVDANFRINPGERVGIVGPNGAGKSTVFALISGEITPDKGSVTVPADCRLGYVHQQLRPRSVDSALLEYAESGRPELVDMEREMHALEQGLRSGAGNDHARRLRRLGDLQTRFENTGGYEVRHRAETILSSLGFDVKGFSLPFASFSGGWQMRAELARVTVAGPEVLLMDEPSNYLDTVAIEWLQRFLREFAGTLVLISHDRFLLNSLCTGTLEIANTAATRYPGNYDAYVRERQQRVELLLATQKKQDRKRRHAERFIERFRAKNTKAAQVQSKIKQLERMEVVAPMQRVVSPGRIRIPHPPRSGHEVVRLSAAGLTYDGQHWVIRDVDLALERGSKTAVVGLNGTGKTTLLRVMAGHLPASEGKRRPGHNVSVGYQSQEFGETLDEQLTVFNTVRQVGARASDEQVRTLLGGFGFSGESIEKRVRVLSGGEKIRLAFARLLMNPPSFLILDEPTTHLDISAREALEEALRRYTGTLCFVSHDIEFVRQVATSVIAMTPPGITRYPGGYDYYREKVAAQEAASGPTEVSRRKLPSQRKTQRRERAEVVQKYSRARREIKKEVDRLEKKIAEFEAEQKKLADRLSSGAPDLGYEDINRRLAEIQGKLSDTNRRWEAFAIELDELEREYTTRRLS